MQLALKFERETRIKSYYDMSYPEYLRSDHWRKKRQEPLKRAKYKCQICNQSTSGLDVHHRSWHRSRGNEDVNDLIVLCRNCHNLFHSHRRIK